MAQGSGARRSTKRRSSAAVRWASRGVWTLVLAILVAWLGWLLVRPFLHPRTHLVLLTGDIVSVDSSPAAIPADYVVEDLRELLSLDEVLHKGLINESGPLILGSLRNPVDMDRLGERLNEQLTGGDDVVLIYVSAHGMSQDGDAWLVASGADPQSPLGGRYRLSALLDQLRECKARTKVLLLDAGRIDYDPLRGMLANDFPARLSELVSERGDKSLWVLCSHSAGQRSHLSAALQRSVFGYFIAEGLKGGADANRDQSVDLAELNRFVNRGVSSWVRQTTGNAAEQTPLLVWGNGSPLPRSTPVLLAVPRERAEKAEQADYAKSIAETRQPIAVNERATARGRSELNSLISTGISRATPQGTLGHYASDAARSAMAKVVSSGHVPGASALAPEEAESKTEEPAGKLEATNVAAGEKAKGDSSADKGDSDKKKDDKFASDEKEPAVPPGKVKDEMPPAAKQPEVSREQVVAQMEQAWHLRDELAAPDRPQSRPVDHAPELWRTLEEELLALDRKLRTGYVVSYNELASRVANLKQNLEWLTSRQPANSLPAGTLARQIAETRPGRVLAAAQPQSLALAELIAREGGPPVLPSLTPLIQRLDRLIAAGNRADLDKLAAELKPEDERWVELRLVRRLAERSDLEWRLVQLLLAASRSGERAAAGELAAPRWVRVTVAEADRARLSAERQLLTSSSFNRATLIESLTAAVDANTKVIADLTEIHSAQRLSHDVWNRLPCYLAWHAAANGAAGAGPTSKDLTQLLSQLESLQELLDQPAAGQATAVRQAAQSLASTRGEIEKALDPLVVEQLISAPITPGEAWRIELLLETLLPSAQIRGALALALPDIDAALGSQVKAVSSANGSPAAASEVRADYERFAVRADLQIQMWKAALSHLANSDFDALVAAHQSWSAPVSSSESADEDSLAYRRERFRTALADLIRGLPARIERGVELGQDLSSPASRGPRLVRLAAWERAQRLVDPRVSNASSGETAVAALDGAAAYDSLVWLRERARQAAEDAPPSEGAFLRALAESYRGAAASIAHQPPLSTGPYSPLEVTGSAQIALTYDSERQVDFVVRNVSSTNLKVWVTAEWNSQFVSVASSAQQAIYPWSQWTAAGGGDDERGSGPLAAARGRPTLELAPDQAATVPLRIVRKKPSLHASHLVLRIATEQHVARHDVRIELPPPEDVQLAVVGDAARWAAQPTGAALYPFPNRTNAFALAVASGKPGERKIDVEVFPLLALPPHGLSAVPLSAADAQRLRGEMSLGPLVAEVRGLLLPSDGAKFPLPLAKPGSEAAPAAGAAPGAAAAAGSATANGAAAKAKAPAADKPPTVPLVQGLLFKITDLADQRQTFKHLEIAPQRPQRYIRPQVRYRAERERIEIKVTAQDATLLPADGVRIHGEIAESLPPDSERQLDAVLKPPLTEAEMFVEVPSAPGRVATLRLTVDDYPRAIYFRVPCSGETGDVPEDVDSLGVRIAGLPEGMIYKPPTARIPLQLEVDAPASALKNPPLVVEVGVDRNRDRELRGDETIMLRSDRQVEAALLGISKTGELLIQTSVCDFTLNVPAAALVSGRANLLAHVVIGDKDAWSEPVEIVIDGESPRISAVELRPDRVVIAGTDLLVSALADDLGLSGVAKLEVMFDLDRSGQFGPTVKSVAGALADDGRWAAKLPTSGLASGSYNVLVRAIDRAGNASQPVRANIRLLSAEQAAADDLAKNAADITGVVMYGDQPQAGMKVSLAANTGAPLAPPPSKAKSKAHPAPSPLATATTNAEGQFKFPKVPPGKYQVTAEGLVKNKNRSVAESVAFKKPAEVQPLTLKLK